MSDPSPYIALALQTTCFAVNGDSNARSSRLRMAEAIARIGAQIAASKRFIGPDVKLVVLPEYFLTGFPMGEPAPTWTEKACLAPEGPEYRALGEIARAQDVFLAGNAYETDENFPGLYFQCSFIFSPEGIVILRYRRLITLFGPSPYDVWDRYVALYGLEGVFPVAETEIGRLAAIASEEVLYPEIARAHAVRGAEIFVHSSSEIAAAFATPKNIAKQARAVENVAYIVSANSAGIEGTAIPRASTEASSKVIDYKGLVLAEAGYGESMAGYSELNVSDLRKYRRRPGMPNTLSRQPMQLWSQAYSGIEIQPPNTMLDGSGDMIIPTPTFYTQRQRAVIDKLADSGLI